MKVTLWNAAVASGNGPDVEVPLSDLPSRVVEPEEGWLVADVVRVGGGYGCNSFVLVTPDLEPDVRVGRLRTIAAAANLFGLRENGELYFHGSEQVAWGDFLRAAGAGLYEGDVERIVLFDYGTAGGTFFEAVPDVVEWVVGSVGIVLTAEKLSKAQQHFSKRRRAAVADQWRRSGVVPARIRKFVQERPTQDPELFGRHFALTESEARFVLHDLGLRELPDGRWKRPGPV